MKRFYLSAAFGLICSCLAAQSFEISNLQESYAGGISESIQAPITLTNKTNSPINLVIRPTGNQQIGTTQRQYICTDAACKTKLDEVILHLEPGETASRRVYFMLDAGLAAVYSTIRYTVSNSSNPQDSHEIELNYSVDEAAVKTNIYSSKSIAIQEVYPNPVVDHAYIDYRIKDDRISAKVAIHNILGNVLNEYELEPTGSTLKIPTEELSPGIYFYTLYVDNESVMTRKMIVRK